MENINKTALNMWKDKLVWISQRYKYLLSSKDDIEVWISKQPIETDVSSHRARIDKIMDEMISIDLERTMIFLNKIRIM